MMQVINYRQLQISDDCVKLFYSTMFSQVHAIRLIDNNSKKNVDSMHRKEPIAHVLNSRIKLQKQQKDHRFFMQSKIASTTPVKFAKKPRALKIIRDKGRDASCLVYELKSEGIQSPYVLSAVFILSD
jgi:hypothetical protein